MSSENNSSQQVGEPAAGSSTTPPGWGNDVNNKHSVQAPRSATIARFESVETSLADIKSLINQNLLLNNQILSKLNAIEKNQSARPGKEAEKEQAGEKEKTGEKEQTTEKDKSQKNKTDSSQEDVGAALYQPKMIANGKSVLHPIAYFSKRLTATQQRYGAQERELLAIVLAIQHWRYWLEGGDVTVRTDHESLKLFRTKAEQPPRIIRFIDVIEHFGGTILVRKGPTNVMADWLSRPPKLEQLTTKPIHSEFNSYVLRTEESVLAAGEDATEQPNGQEEEPQPQPEVQQVTRINHLNRIDLQAIFEFLLLSDELPERLSAPWVRKNFALHEDALRPGPWLFLVQLVHLEKVLFPRKGLGTSVDPKVHTSLYHNHQSFQGLPRTEVTVRSLTTPTSSQIPNRTTRGKVTTKL